MVIALIVEPRWKKLVAQIAIMKTSSRGNLRTRLTRGCAMNDYEGRYVIYNCGEYFGDALFIPKCPHCGRFVKADKLLSFSHNMLDDYRFGPTNATCSLCGKVQMPFEGWW